MHPRQSRSRLDSSPRSHPELVRLRTRDKHLFQSSKVYESPLPEKEFASKNEGNADSRRNLDESPLPERHFASKNEGNAYCRRNLKKVIAESELHSSAKFATSSTRENTERKIKQPCAKNEEPCAKNEEPCAKNEEPCAKNEETQNIFTDPDNWIDFNACLAWKVTIYDTETRHEEELCVYNNDDISSVREAFIKSTKCRSTIRLFYVKGSSCVELRDEWILRDCIRNRSSIIAHSGEMEKLVSFRIKGLQKERGCKASRRGCTIS